MALQSLPVGVCWVLAPFMFESVLGFLENNLLPEVIEGLSGTLWVDSKYPH